MKNKKQRVVGGDHCLNVFVSYELKEQIKALAKRHDRTVASMIRAILKIGIPMMKGISDSEELMVKEYIQLFRKLRQMKNIKEI